MEIVVPQSEGLIARCHNNPGAKDESGETIDLKEEQKQFFRALCAFQTLIHFN